MLQLSLRVDAAGPGRGCAVQPMPLGLSVARWNPEYRSRQRLDRFPTHAGTSSSLPSMVVFVNMESYCPEGASSFQSLPVHSIPSQYGLG